MRVLGGSGIWEIFIPDVVEGAAYKFEILTEGGDIRREGNRSLPSARAASAAFHAGYQRATSRGHDHPRHPHPRRGVDSHPLGLLAPSPAHEPARHGNLTAPQDQP